MRYLTPFLLLAAPLGAQTRAIAPAPSALFVPMVSQGSQADTVKPHTRMSTWEGSMVGAMGGLLAGFALSKVVEAKSPCACEDPGLDRAVSYGFTGLLVGAVVGGALAGRE